MEDSDIPLKDPMPDLAPTARRLLEAAIRVLDREGFKALTFEKTGREAGENAALIRYHFGSKAGLVSTLADAVLYRRASEMIRVLSEQPAGEARRETLFRMQRDLLVADSTGFVRLFELVPNARRNPELLGKLRDVMRWFRSLDAWALGGEDPGPHEVAAIEPLAVLAPAILNGLALEAQADPELAIEPAFELWKQLVMDYLKSLKG